MNDDRPPVLTVDGLCKSFTVRRRGKASSVVAANDVSFTIGEGEVLALVGESGSGKSTVGRLALRLIEADSGTVTLNGTDLRSLKPEPLRRLRSTAQIIFQDPMGSLDPLKTVGQSIAEPLATHLQLSKNDRTNEVRRLLDTVDLEPDLADRYPAQLSGGMRQRVAIARALGLNPTLIVCDEPTSALDASTQATIINLLRRLSRERRIAYLFISHDLAMVRHIADRVAVMYLGRIVEEADAASLFADAQHPYTRSLLSALPSTHHSKGTMFQHTPAKSAVASTERPEDGCAYAPRCPLAIDICLHEAPLLKPVGSGHRARCHLAGIPVDG